jgi:hypothetical protein
LYQKKNRYRVDINSPVFVLPIESTYHGYCPVWVVRTGDLTFKTSEAPRDPIIKKMKKSMEDFESFANNAFLGVGAIALRPALSKFSNGDG